MLLFPQSSWNGLIYLYKEIAMNMLMTVTELEMSNQRGKVIKTMKLEKWSSGKIGNPVKL